MSRFSRTLRGLLISLPIIALSGMAVFEASAQFMPEAVTVPSGIISTQVMSDFEAYPSGVNLLAAPNVPPLIMLVMSRDEQLFNKAYPDYTDLNNDGVVDTTYLDSFPYNGYFDPNICYVYDSSNKYYKAAANVSSGTHQCATGNNYWSGNFMNWVAMSRLDILRWAFYGGTRSTDTAAKTVLERAEIPDDIHAWPKVYTGSDINKYAPFSGPTTFCNVSSNGSGGNGTTGAWKTATTTTSGVQSTPVIRIASKAWGDWAATEGLQCQLGGDSSRPTTATDYVARVQVCQNTSGVPNESFCVVDGAALKPEGLLQKYSKNDDNAKRFGLVTGSAVNARIGGQLRRNVGKLENNIVGTACATGTGAGDGDEFSNLDGTFCYKSAGATPAEGIVYTLDHLQIVGWNGTNYGTSKTTDCYNTATGTAWGARGYLIQGTPTMCPDFGNPLAGMYAVALNYIQGLAAPSQDTSGPLPNPTWVDPYGALPGGKQRNQECAGCSIVLVSSGLNTFDTQNVPAVSGVDPASLTNTIQSDEGISGKYTLSTYYGGPTGGSAPAYGSLTTAGTIYSDVTICQSATIGSLSNIAGLCNGAPGQQGGYLLAGLSLGAWNPTGSSPIRTTGVVKNFQVKTYGVSLSENLPAFTIPVGTDSISISPSCRADPANTGNNTTCYIGNVNLTPPTDLNKKYTYGLVPDATHLSVGSYYIMWEDSQYGSDHDMDADNVISWCVGTSCKLPSALTGKDKICDPEIYNGNKSSAISEYDSSNPVCKNGSLTFTPGASDVIIRNEDTSFSSAGMYLGYQVSGTNADGLTELYINSGNNAVFGCNLLADAVDCSSKPQVRRFTTGSSTAVGTLQAPLWYAAKYSGFAGSSPTLVAGTDPANYFLARNAGALKDNLDAVFQQITSTAANNFGNATTPSSSNDVKGNGLSYQVQYYQTRFGVNWTGSLQAFWSDSSGYQREGTVASSGNQVLDNGADYVVSGPDTTVGALAGALASWRCSVPPIPSGAATTFDPSASSACAIVSTQNPLKPAWDAATLLNAYYDPTAAAGSADAKAIANLAKQRVYNADASASANVGQRYIFTYLTSSPDGASGSGTVTTGTQTDFVWDDDSCGTSGTYTLSATSGFCGKYDATNLVRTGNYSLLNEKDPALAKKLVNWVRGVEDPTDYRSRTNNLSVGNNSTYRLGDIVDSSPTIVGTPAESYDLLYSDFSYAAFRSNYVNRRQMVYVGANDGMLHAFNGGFYVTGQGTDGTTGATDPTAYRQLPSGLTSGDKVATQGNNWALGQEAWAFVPSNLLAHLRWLADKNYTHVFYVDGSPVVTDAQIFTSSTITGSSASCQAGTPVAADIDANGHVCGWGTVMVVPFRLGGGAISVDTVGKVPTVAANVQASNSAYVILDVTDPEVAPTVLGEITTGTYTLGEPAFSVHREHLDGKLHFLLTLGSGPADNGGVSGTKAVSAPAGKNMRLWVYDMASIVGNSSTPVAAFTNGPVNSFAGDMVGSDFNLNYSSESVYFGVVTNPPPQSTPPAAPVPQIYGGGLWKLDMNTGPATNGDGTANPPDTSDPATWTLTQVINNGQPVTIRPTVALDSAGRPMIYFGTGRSYTTDDDSGASSQGTQQQYIYGVSDNSLLTSLPSSCRVMPSLTTLFNASSVNVGTDDTVTGTGLPSGLGTTATLDNLENILLSTATTGDNCFEYSGWELALTAGHIAGNPDGSNSQVPSERVVSSQTLLGGILLTPTYLPPSKATIDNSGSSDCDPVPVPGTSNLYGMNYLTGTADPSLAGSFGGTAVAISRTISLGSGKASSPVLHSSGGNVTAAFGLSGGTILQNIGALNGAQNGEISWREPVDNQ